MFSFCPHGFVFGKKGFSYLIKPEYEDGHILVSGGSGSRKTTSLAIPSLVSWRHRVFAVDIKGTLQKKTAFARPSIKVFNPLDHNSYGFDPYFALKVSKNQAQTAREIALSIVPHERGEKPFFAEGAQSILTGAILHFFSLDYSFLETMLAIQSTPREELIKEIFNSGTEKAGLCVKDFYGMDKETLSNIFPGLSNKIIPFITDDDLIDSLSKEKNISPNDLENGFDVYLCIPEDKLEEWKSLLTLISRQFLNHFYRRPDEDKNLTPILFLLDEFPRLGTFEGILHALATLRSKKITICLIIQDPAQLDMVYGHDATRTIMANCRYKAILECSDVKSQEYFSNLIGTEEEIKTSQNTSYGGEDTDTVRSTGVSETPQEKRIRKPADLAYLPKRNIIDLLSPDGYFCIKKLPYNAGRFRQCKKLEKLCSLTIDELSIFDMDLPPPAGQVFSFVQNFKDVAVVGIVPVFNRYK